VMWSKDFKHAVCNCAVDTPSSSLFDVSDHAGMFTASSVLATPSVRVSHTQVSCYLSVT